MKEDEEGKTRGKNQGQPAPLPGNYKNGPDGTQAKKQGERPSRACLLQHCVGVLRIRVEPGHTGQW